MAILAQKCHFLKKVKNFEKKVLPNWINNSISVMLTGDKARHETKGKQMKNDIMNSILNSKEHFALRTNFIDLYREYHITKAEGRRDFWLSHPSATLFGWKVEFHVKAESVHVSINSTDVFFAHTMGECLDWVTAQIMIGNGSFDEKE